jgi:tetratricopeptide (TPR) repeat protein
MKSYKNIIILTLTLAIFLGCEDRLDEEVFSELAPSTLFASEKGVTSVLNASYAYAHRSGNVQSWAPFHMGTMPAGEAWGVGGSIESIWQRLIDYNWDSNHDHLLPMWVTYYNSIRDANIVLDNLQNDALSEAFKERTEAECHFLRGWSYSELYKLFGRLPLFRSPADDPLLPRASEEETKAFIEEELTLAVATLPAGRAGAGVADKGTAMAILAKYYLNTKQWQKAADLFQDIIDLNQYSLIPNYADVFAVENEDNAEIIWALPKTPISATASQLLNALIFAPDFPRPFPNNAVFAARTYLFDDFVNSFEPSDTRTSQIITEYTSTATGAVVVGLGSDRSHPYKLPFDPNSVGVNSGNDIPIIRYADILLSLAEALNELNGPSQEAIDLINLVRERANATPLVLTGYSQASLREAILQEREWEFYFEGNAREDQIRHGVLISRAQARGKNAQDFHVLFPIPQIEIDANAALEQNPGY